MKATTEFDWKQIGDEHYIYRVKTGKILGSTSPTHYTAEGSLYKAEVMDEGSLGEYVNLAYARAALLEAVSSAVTRKTVKRA